MAEPYCLAMVLCDGVHRDATTGKMTILGTFSTISLRDFSAAVVFCIYFSLTDGLGTNTISLRIRESRATLSDENGLEEPLFDLKVFEQPMEFPDPLMVIEAGMVIPVPFPRCGQYHCELYAQEQVLMARRLMVITPPEEQHQENQ